MGPMRDEGVQSSPARMRAFRMVARIPAGTAPGSDAALANVDAWLAAADGVTVPVDDARALLADWLENTQHVSCLADLGVPSADGFSAGMRRRLLHQVLPEDIEVLSARIAATGVWLLAGISRDALAYLLRHRLAPFQSPTGRRCMLRRPGRRARPGGHRRRCAGAAAHPAAGTAQA
jgi:hypothetical protein